MDKIDTPHTKSDQDYYRLSLISLSLCHRRFSYPLTRKFIIQSFIFSSTILPFNDVVCGFFLFLLHFRTMRIADNMCSYTNAEIGMKIKTKK